MRVFLFTVFVSLFLGISLYTAIWYTQTYLTPKDPLATSQEVGHLENLFAAKVSDQEAEVKDDNEWEWEEEQAEESHDDKIQNNKESAVEAPIPKKKEAVVRKDVSKGIPRGKVDKSTFEFGSVDQGEMLEHTFRILNRGTGPLKILNYEVDCGCTMVDLPAKPIMPGKSAEIKTKFDTKDKVSLQYKKITLRTNGSPKYLVLAYKGWVYPPNFGKEKPAEETPKDSVKGK